MNNGNVNNNNKNNKNSVLALSEFQGKQEAGAPVFYITDDSLRDAYRRCLKHKKSTTNTAIFRVNELANLKELLLDIQAGTYYPGTSIAFMTEGREVFAAEFRDRIVHTWCAMRIIPLLERQFVPTTWNCREGKGTLRAVQNLRSQIRAVSENYTRDAWVMIFDLSGFFMNINREQAADRLCRFIAKRNEQNAQDFANSLNSYFGIMKHYDCEEIKQKLVGLIEQDWFGYFTVIDNEKFAMRVPRRVRLRRELRAQRKEFNNLKYSIKCSL